MSTIRLEFAPSGVATVTLDRGDGLNIYNLAMRDELIEAFAAVHDHPETRVLLLRADGPNFSAGADLREFGTAESILDARRIRWSRDPWLPLWELPQPTVVALHGHALGAGLEMALLCSVRLAAPNTRLGLPETRLGMLPSAGGTQSLTRAIGVGASAPVVLLAATMSAEEAAARRIVDLVTDDVDAAALAIAERLAGLPAEPLRAARRALRTAGEVSLEPGLRLEKVLAARLASSAAAGAGAGATC